MQAGAHNKKQPFFLVVMPPTWLGILTLNAINLYHVATCTVPSEG